ncbi:conserved unknown protein [Ectocarpus siliculosus]|uniref:Protein HGH1 homolog n=1 Tax=Ectocarpus siliculosus TaxID=2880 RepID=D7G1I7_ECTSI|nr:conserved unknown protein [Ectocarpus siliculosus]|eukprot:CBJ26795.1 conserved unknown protein [Ectocarpus siliculosus]
MHNESLSTCRSLPDLCALLSLDTRPMSTFEGATAGTKTTGEQTEGNHGERNTGSITRELIEETVPFLRDPRPEIRQAAAATAVAASATKEGVALLHKCGAVKWLCRISGDVGTIGKDAVSCLVNVSAEETSVAALEDMCKAGIVNRMMEAVSDEQCIPFMRDLCLQLLANVTRVQVGATKLAQVGVAGGALREGQYIRRLARWLAKHPADNGLPYPVLVGGSRDDARVVDRRAALRDTQADDDDDDEGRGATQKRERKGGEVLDQWQHCASVLCNAARIPEGRRALRRPDPLVALTEVLPQLASANPVRRWGVAGCVRNCCFEELDHPWLLHEVKVVPHLLMRLADDKDEYDFEEKVILDPRVWRKEKEEGSYEDSPAAPRRREPVQCIKRDIVEALLQLCAILESRQSLRKCGVYFVIREMDKSEPDAEISQVCYNLVNFLQRDEQDKQGRIDYLKSLADSEGKEAAGSAGEDPATTEPSSEIEVMPPSTASPGSTADRTAFLRDKLVVENGGGAAVEKKGGSAQGGGGAKEEEAVEEFVGEEGGDAMIEMLSAFDDDSGDDET